MGIEMQNIFGIIIDVCIVVFLLVGVGVGYKKGILGSVIVLLSSVVSAKVAYFFRGWLAGILYENFPFFNFSGNLDGVSAINIIIYEFVAFIILWFVLTLVCSFLSYALKLDRLSAILAEKFKIINKILGLVIGAAESYLFVYFVALAGIFAANMFGYNMDNTLASRIYRTPLLNETFTTSYDALNEIVTLSSGYQNPEERIYYNKDAFDILIKYNLISQEDVDSLVEDGKIIVDGSKQEQ